MINLEFLLYALIFILVGLMLVSFFLVWQWFDARDRLKIVRETTREQTIQAIHHVHNKCRILLFTSFALTLCYIPIPFALHTYYGTLAYPGVVALADILMLFGLRARAKSYIGAIDDRIQQNEDHAREAIAEKEREREQMRKDAPRLNKETEALVKELFDDKYELWFRHDILFNHCVLANRELDLLYAQGVVVRLSEIMEVRKGRMDLKLVTSNSLNPFIVIDFGVLPINPETGCKYMDEIADKLEKIIH
ncbi:MAG: hypothetical protein IKX20_05935 [Paludibacteraceae bacterium]|nr:hypothetical protein [Paludibacteraceae bacterium]